MPKLLERPRPLLQPVRRLRFHRLRMVGHHLRPRRRRPMLDGLQTPVSVSRGGESGRLCRASRGGDAAIEGPVQDVQQRVLPLGVRDLRREFRQERQQLTSSTRRSRGKAVGTIAAAQKTYGKFAFHSPPPSPPAFFFSRAKIFSSYCTLQTMLTN